VSAVVLPDDGAVAEHVQRAMFGDDDDRPIDLEKLQRTARDLRDTAYAQLELQRYLQRMQADQQADVQRHLDRARGRLRSVDAKVPYRPRKAWREWADFVRIMQAIEADGIVPVSKEWVASQLGVVPRTITRAMEYHGLAPDDWPPSTWDPARPPAKKHEIR